MFDQRDRVNGNPPRVGDLPGINTLDGETTIEAVLCKTGIPNPVFRDLQMRAKKATLRLMKAIKAHYDGRVIVPEEPVDLPANTPVRVLLPEADDDAAVITKEFAQLSETSFSRIWDNDEDAAYDKL